MTVDEVKNTRDVLRSIYKDADPVNGKPQKGLKIRLDNNFEIHEIREFVSWDDANQRIIWIERTEEVTIQRTRPFFVHCSNYENIQEIYVEMSQEELKHSYKALGFTDKQFEMIVGSYTMRTEDYADSVSNQVKGRAHDITT